MRMAVLPDSPMKCDGSDSKSLYVKVPSMESRLKTETKGSRLVPAVPAIVAKRPFGVMHI